MGSRSSEKLMAPLRRQLLETPRPRRAKGPFIQFVPAEFVSNVLHSDETRVFPHSTSKLHPQARTCQGPWFIVTRSLATQNRHAKQQLSVVPTAFLICRIDR